MAERIIAPTASPAEFTEIYKKTASEASLPESFTTEKLISLLYGIYAELLEANRKFNLTAITALDGVTERHLVDCLMPLKLLAEKGLLRDGDTVCDIGAGAGFPTLPIAAAAEAGAVADIKIHAVDSTAKKIGHIKSTAEKLGLARVSGTAGRAEELASTAMRESFDVVTARAVSAMPVLIELAAPFVKVGGAFAAMKAHSDEEVAAASRAAEILGFDKPETTEYTLPSGDVRSLVIYKKIKSTPDKYPRMYSKIVSKPL